ncbi:MAG: heavy-metal-associated domain-containing protein [Oscillospiraceae bacterium]|nr:heavy-metal-associated domain-containing protein [Oscillospiraceae bacterium]
MSIRMRLTAIICAGVMLCAMIIPVAGSVVEAESEPEMRKTDLFDFIEILQYMVELVELPSIEMYDFNKDGVVDLFDGLMVLSGLVGIESPVMILCNPPLKQTATSEFIVNELDCIKCEDAIVTILSGLSGIVDVSVTWDTKTVKVVHDEKLTADSIKAHMENYGFTVSYKITLPQIATTVSETIALPQITMVTTPLPEVVATTAQEVTAEATDATDNFSETTDRPVQETTYAPETTTLPETTTEPPATTTEPVITAYTSEIIVCGYDVCCIVPLTNLLMALDGILNLSVVSDSCGVKYTILHETWLGTNELKSYIRGRGYNAL